MGVYSASYITQIWTEQYSHETLRPEGRPRLSSYVLTVPPFSDSYSVTLKNTLC